MRCQSICVITLSLSDCVMQSGENSRPFKIIQLTDSHLFSDIDGGMYGLKTLESFKAVCAEVAQLSCDLILATGDISQDESQQSYEYFRDVLLPTKVPTHVIPGNHDDIRLMSKVFGTGSISCEKRVVLGGWQILMLSTQQPSQVAGFLSDGELEWLELNLLNDSLKTVVCIHHHPIAMGSRWLDQIGLQNSDALFAILAKNPQVKALLWGHVHQASDEMRAGLRLMSSPSTCIQFKPRTDQFELDMVAPGYRWMELYESGEIKTGIKRLAEVPATLDPELGGY